MIANWPVNLPPPQRDSWQYKPQEARRKRQNDAGPAGYRRRYSSVAKSVSMSLKLTHGQRAVFDQFFAETCQQGSVRFWMPDPTNDGWALTNEGNVALLVNAISAVPLEISEQWLCAWGDELPTETVVDQVKFLKSFSIWVLP